MRVAVDATALYSARTGVGAFVTETLTRLPSRGVDVSAFAITWRGRGRLAEMVPDGVTARQRGPMAARLLRALWLRADWPRIELWTGAVDLVHGPNFVVPPTKKAARLVTIHDLTPIRFPQLANRDTLQYPGLLRRALAGGAHVHAVSHFVAREVLEVLGADASRVHVIPNGVPEVGDGNAARGAAVAGGPRYVLALGTVEPRKDLPLLVRAFDALAADDRDVRLVLAGPDGWGAASLDAALAAVRNRDRITRLGWVDDRTRADLLAGATVFAYPSRYEGFGLPPLEAMRCGVPVVTTATGALPEVVADAAELVPPGDVDALSGALVRLLTDESRRAELQARGTARVERFSWDRCVDELAALYRRLA